MEIIAKVELRVNDRSRRYDGCENGEARLVYKLVYKVGR